MTKNFFSRQSSKKHSIGYGYSCNHVTFCWYADMKLFYNMKSRPANTEFAVM